MPTPRLPLARRALLSSALAAPAAVILARAASAAPTTVGPTTAAGTAAADLAGPLGASAVGPRVRGADLSFTLQLEAAGARWSADGCTAPVERLFHEAGANWMRIRVWVNPPAGYSTLHDAVVLARRAKQAGMKVLLDLHYSDFWADPAHQSIPAAWVGQNLHQLAGTVRRYTAHALETLSDAGAPADMVQIGNEITSGMLWPLGQLYDGSADQNWPSFTTLLGAGIAGARMAKVTGKPPEVMIHIDRGGDNGGSRYFFDHVLAAGLDFDVIGESYYPFWHGPLQDLQANLVDLATRYGKDLIVAETAYPWTLANGDDLTNILNSRSQLPDARIWPPTPQGQLAYFTALRGVFDHVPGGHGLGFMSWEPEWIPGVGWTPGQGNPNDNLTLFDFHGRALPALQAFTPGRIHTDSA
ncbi:MAG: glycosyl hydrolase 53 family protein [Lapillicoccus sp.]